MTTQDEMKKADCRDWIRVPYGRAMYGDEEIEAVTKALKNSSQMGEAVSEMESKIALLFKKKYGLMVNSGSSANYLAIEALNLPKGSEIITPVLTFSTTVAPIVRNGCIPVFVDVEERTFNIDVNQIEPLVSKMTKALMIPNLIGNLPDWKKIREIADKYNLVVIEDSADAIGTKINGVSTGEYSDITTTSFYGSHIISCAGNGGMVCFNSEESYKKAKLLRSWGRSSSLFQESEKVENRFEVSLDGIQYDNKFVFQEFGYNLEPSEIGAAFGLVQLEKLEHNIALREKWFDRQILFFQKYSEWFLLPKQLKGSKTAWLAFPLIVKENAPFNRTDLQIFLEKRNIQTRTIFTGNILRQPCFKDSSIAYKPKDYNFKNADNVMRGGILLACHNGLEEEMVEHMHSSIDIFCSSYR